MNELILNGYTLLSVMLPFSIAFIVVCRLRKKRGVRLTAGYAAQVYLYAFYLLLVFYVTGAGTLYDALRMGIVLRTDEVSLIPFENYFNMTGYVLNAIMFLPFGFLLPLIWPGANRFWVALLGGFGFSLLIEASQLLNHRATDVDDLIMNTLGAAAGFLLYRLFALITGRKKRPRAAGPVRFEAGIYLAAAFLGRFFLFNELPLAKWLYGF